MKLSVLLFMLPLLLSQSAIAKLQLDSPSASIYFDIQSTAPDRSPLEPAFWDLIDHISPFPIEPRARQANSLTGVVAVPDLFSELIAGGIQKMSFDFYVELTFDQSSQSKETIRWMLNEEKPAAARKRTLLDGTEITDLSVPSPPSVNYVLDRSRGVVCLGTGRFEPLQDNLARISPAIQSALTRRTDDKIFAFIDFAQAKKLVDLYNDLAEGDELIAIFYDGSVHLIKAGDYSAAEFRALLTPQGREAVKRK